MKRNIIATLFVVLLFTSCASIGSMMSIDSNMKKVKIGMTKEEVVSIVGKHYEIVGANEVIETIAYQPNETQIYILQFEKGKLIEWHKEWLPHNARHHSD